MKAGNNGISENTKQHIPFGAGTIHKGLKFSGSAWNFAETCVGATKGGSSVTITPNIVDIEVDGAAVGVKGYKKKVGETAEMEINFAELTVDLIKAAIFAKTGSSSDATGYDLLESSPDIQSGDYWDNIAFVGETLEGKKIIVVLPNALCTSGLPLEGKSGEQGTIKLTFVCTADDTGEADTLPYKIYYPTAG